MSLTQDLAKHLGGVPVASMLPFYNGGNVYFVDAFNGSDGNSGKTPAKALRSVEEAYNRCEAGNNDVVFLLSNTDATDSTNDYTSRFDEAFTWAKNRTHLIGAAAPTHVSQRARISVPTTQTAAVDPLITVSSIGSIFMNVQVFNGINAAVAANGVKVTGARNYFYNVHFAGMGDASGDNDLAGGYSLSLDGGDENTFERCTIGLETSPKGANANSEIVFANAAERNYFRDCKIMTFANAATHQYVLAGASAIEGTTVFENCLFTNKIQGGSTAMTEAFSVNATQNGNFTLINSFADAGDWEASPTDHVRTLGAVTDQGILGSVS